MGAFNEPKTTRGDNFTLTSAPYDPSQRPPKFGMTDGQYQSRGIQSPSA